MKTLYLRFKTVFVKEESDEAIKPEPDFIDEHHIQLPRGLCLKCLWAAHDKEAEHCGHCRCCK